MPLITRSQFAMKTESTYGTPVTVDRFFEGYQEDVLPDHRRIESKNLRAATRVQRADRFVPWKAGARGTFGFEPLSKGFGAWLVHMLGTVATAGPTDSAYTHTATIGDLKGDSFTFQSNRPFHPADTDQAYTYSGCKLPMWELSCAAGGLLDFRFTIDAQDYTTATALATASYPSGTLEPFSFLGASVTIGGSAFNFADSVKLTCDNGLRTDEYRLKASGLKGEQQETAFRTIAWEINADFDSLTQANRFYSATASGALATVVLTFESATLIGSTAKPKFVITIDQARFDEASNPISGPDALKQKLSGKGLFSSSSALTIAYTSADSTP